MSETMLVSNLGWYERPKVTTNERPQETQRLVSSFSRKTKGLFVKVRNQFPPVWAEKDIVVVQRTEALRQRNLVLGPSLLSRNDVDLCHLQWKLAEIDRLKSVHSGVYLGMSEPIWWCPRFHS